MCPEPWTTRLVIDPQTPYCDLGLVYTLLRWGQAAHCPPNVPRWLWVVRQPSGPGVPVGLWGDN